MPDEISDEEAEELVSSGEWIGQSQIPVYLYSYIEPLMRVILADEQVRDKVLVKSEPIILGASPEEVEELKKAGLLEEEEEVPRLSPVINELSKYIESTLETKRIQETQMTPELFQKIMQREREEPSFISHRADWIEQAWRGRENVIIKISPTLDKLKWVGFAVIGTILAVARWDALAFIATGATVLSLGKDVIPALQTSWERLSDPKECYIFETIALLQSSYTVRNYDALKQGNYAQAYGKLTPSLEEIEDAIASHLLQQDLPESWQELSTGGRRDDLLKTMNALKERNVLKELNNHWSIVCPVPDIINTATRRGIGSNGPQTEELYARVQTEGSAGKHAA